MRVFVLVLCVCCFGEGFGSTAEKKQDQGSMFENVPENWRAETLVFPLGFAPQIEYQGVEELHFAPGMFKKGAPDYFSYLFAWRLDSLVDLNAQVLEKDLLVYFKGLYQAVSKRKQPVDGFRVHLVKTPDEKNELHGYTGKAGFIDPFVTETWLELNLEIRVWQCAKNKQTWALFRLSPKSLNSKIFEQMRSVKLVECHRHS